MSEHDWLEVLLRRTFEVGLPELTLLEGGSARFHGSGRLVWNWDSGLRILGVTDGGETLTRRFLSLGGAPGKLIPRETFVSAAGRTLDGWDVSTTPVALPGYIAHWDSPHVLWGFKTFNGPLSSMS